MKKRLGLQLLGAACALWRLQGVPGGRRGNVDPVSHSAFSHFPAELCLRVFSGTVAIHLSELFNALSLQKGETSQFLATGNGLCLLWSELDWGLFWKVLSGP